MIGLATTGSSLSYKIFLIFNHDYYDIDRKVFDSDPSPFLNIFIIALEDV